MEKMVSSTEEYKGYRLDVVMVQDSRHPALCHRSCEVYNAEGECVSHCKSKREAKELLDDGSIQAIERMK